MQPASDLSVPSKSAPPVIPPGSLVLLQGTTGLTAIARRIRGAGGNWRAPHHTCSGILLLAELGIAAGGVLFIDEVLEFRRLTLQHLFRAWTQASSLFRPVLLVGLRLPDGRGIPHFNTPDAWWRRLHSLAEVLPPVDAHLLIEPPGSTERPVSS